VCVCVCVCVGVCVCVCVCVCVISVSHLLCVGISDCVLCRSWMLNERGAGRSAATLGKPPEVHHPYRVPHNGTSLIRLECARVCVGVCVCVCEFVL